jgi:DNA-binding transcriptional LysR family regulator
MSGTGRPFIPVPRAFNRRHPNVFVHLSTGTSGGEIESLRRGEADLAILVPPPHYRTGGLEIRPLKTERMMLALSVDHPIARRRRVRLSELAEEPLARIQQEVTQLPLAPALVAAGMCVAMVCESMCRVLLERPTFVDLVDDDDAAITYSLAFALRKGEGPDTWVAPFMEIAHEVVAEGSAAMPASDRGRRQRR